MFVYDSDSKGIAVLSLNFERYFTYDPVLLSYGVLKIAILTNLGQIMRDQFRPINACAEISSVLEIVPN